MTEKTCIFGNGPCAQRIAEQLLTAGDQVIIVSGNEEPEVFSETRLSDDAQQIEILSSTDLTAINGTCGNYTLSLVSGGKEIVRRVSTVIIAEENGWQPNHSLYGLESTEQVLSLTQMASALDGGRGHLPPDLRHVVFLNSLANENHPAVTGEIMGLCLILQSELNVQTYVLTGNLKVAADGLEALYRRTKEAGVLYVKFTDNQPEMICSDDSRIRIEFKDEVTGQDFRLTPDLIVVDEANHPTDTTKKISEVLELETDGLGFPQTENVHRLTGYTNRKGILVAGPARTVMSGAEQVVDADTVSLTALQLQRFSAEPSNDRAVISTARCVRCLTCHRLCPYRAIELDKRVTVMPDACERCGICAAECPRGAISIAGLSGSDIQAQFEIIPATRSQSRMSPTLAVFCCSRSAVQSWNLSALMTSDLPENLRIIEVPCAGSLSTAHLLSAFQNGADGVLMLTCHEGNCHSDQGNALAGRRAAQLKDLLPHLGLESDRLAVNSLAANMGAEFAEIVKRFEQTIKGLVVNNSAKPQRH